MLFAHALIFNILKPRIGYEVPFRTLKIMFPEIWPFEVNQVEHFN